MYVLEPEVLEMIPAGRMFSIERGVFPRLAQAGSLFGHVDRGYWRDIGTPDSYLQAHIDILEQTVRTGLADESDNYCYLARSADIHESARVVPPTFIGEGAHIGPGARVGPLAVIGAGSVIAEGASVTESVVQARVVIGAHAQVDGSVLVRDSSRRRGHPAGEAPSSARPP